jgi:hypothetical protein
MLELEPGTLVVCTYRLPSEVQPWMHEIHVGVVEAPGNDPKEWSGTNSERHYCEQCKVTRVSYNFGVRHDNTNDLIPITSPQATLSHREKIALFLGKEALDCYNRHMR